MKKNLFLAFTLIITTSFTSFAQFKNLNDAINHAGKQRMLSQRIAKSFLMIAADINIEKYKGELDNSMAQFEEAHHNLKRYFEKDQKMNPAMEKVERIWFNFRETVSSTAYTKVKCNSVLSSSAFLLKATEEVVALSATGDKSKVGKIVDMSGSLRMLSQQIGLFYVASYLELPSDQIKIKFDGAIKTIDKRLVNLIGEKVTNTNEIASKLRRASQNWAFAKRNLKLSENLKPATVGVTLNSFMREMDDITALYTHIPTPQ
ncbi:type IV pili methyl-accepting chemotaxis transducer N-terminal domain-containing protein [Aquimarina rhabdastrellae]